MQHSTLEIKFRFKHADSPELFNKLVAMKDGTRSAYIRELLLNGYKGSGEQEHKEAVEEGLHLLREGIAQQKSMLARISEKLDDLSLFDVQPRPPSRAEAPKQEQRATRAPNYGAGETDIDMLPDDEVAKLQNSTISIMAMFGSKKNGKS